MGCHKLNSDYYAYLAQKSFYFYSKDGMISAREVNGKLQNYEYDLKGQLTGVKDKDGNYIEQYVYDPAGNILKKTVDGKTTSFTYDAANQLATAILPDGSKQTFEYDGAGRLTKDGDKSYAYGWMNKVLSVADKGNVSNFEYFADGQLSGVSRAFQPDKSSQKETFTWDGLALIKRDETDYTVESAASGGNAILASGKILFNDMAGSSLGSFQNNNYTEINRNSFGYNASSAINEDFFTGKPNIEGLGYAFFLRNYKPETGKWMSADPLGYPDGWNNLAYVNNHATTSIDPLGGEEYYGYYYYDNDEYYYSGTNYFVGGQAQSEINNLTDALSHYRSGAGGTVPAGSGLYGEMKSNSTYANNFIGNNCSIATIIADKLLNVSKSNSSGSFQNSPGSSRAAECSTLGSYSLDINYTSQWNAGAWQHDSTGDFRYVETDVTVGLSGSDSWDFNWNASYNLWQNISRELIPGWIAGARGNPAPFTIGYQTSESYHLMVRQPE
jgi:RHS repeat-associated protein